MPVNTEKIGNYITSSQIPLLLFDSDGIPLHMNEAAKHIIKKISPEEGDFATINVWTRMERLCSEENVIKLRFLIEQNTPHFTFDLHIPGTDSGQLWLKFVFSRHQDGVWLVLIDDVTQQKLKERHLVSAKEDAEKASTTRSQFLANISHEIRTPIQTIIGMVELLAETRLDEEQIEYTRQVRFSADVLLTLINDILDLSKGEAGLLKIEEISFDLVDCIEKTVDLVSIEAHRKGLELIVDIHPQVPETVIGDPGRLRQVILNLVKNAVKFTAQGMVCVRVSIQKILGGSSIHETHDYILVEVIDTGIGISYEARARLFTLFYQADSSTSRRFGGTGLGLAISKNIVTLMNGDIGMKSNDPGGSNFWFHLPLVRPSVTMETVHKPARPGMRILLVDDHEETLNSLSRTFSGLGYTHISQATSGMFALAMLHAAEQARRPFDIAFIDMVMPEMDGWRLAAEINKNRTINQVQLYLMVPEGAIGADAKMKLLEWFNGYLYKPVKRRMLAQLMDEQLQSSIDLEVVEDHRTVTTENASTAVQSEQPPVPTIEEPPPFPGLSVLVVEDHPVNQKLLRIFLEKAGCMVTTANDGTEALDAAQQKDFSVVFMDIQMPKLNGYLATKELRLRGFNKPVIACTASAQEDEREQCLSYGMDDILTKPFRRQDVLDALQKWHDRQRSTTTMTNDDTETILDIPLLKEIVMNDIDTARSLMSEFLDQTREHIILLERDIGDGELQAIRQTAHLIKGSALNVTARQLAACALYLEQNAETATRDDLHKALIELQQAFSRVEKESVAL